MTIYYILWICSLLVMACPTRGKNSYRVKLIICFALLFVFGAFRYDFGLDYQTYEMFYNYVKGMHVFSYNSKVRMEVGYAFLNYLCPSFRFLIIMTTAVVCIAYYNLFKRYIPENYAFLAMLLLYLSGNNTIFFMFSGIRNGIAISILILSMPFIEKRKLIPFIVMTALAWSMHYSALIVFPVAYALGYVKRITPKVAVVMMVVGVVIFIIPFDLLISSSAKIVQENLDRYSGYIAKAKEIGNGPSWLVFISNITIITIMGFGLRKTDIDHRQSVLLLLGMMAFYMPLLGPLDIRLSIYFGGIMLVALVIAYHKIFDIVLKNAMLGIVIAYKAYSFFVVWLNNPYFAYDKIHNYVIDYLVGA